MTTQMSEQAAVAVLDQEYRTYITQLKADWISKNRLDSKDVYEVMRPEQQAEVRRRLTQGDHYVTPLAETWWKEHGYGIVWPDDNTKPMKVYKL